MINFDLDDIEMIVTAANISGYLEAGDKISIESDTNLTDFILEKLKDYREIGWKYFMFVDFIEYELIKNFGNKKEQNGTKTSNYNEKLSN